MANLNTANFYSFSYVCYLRLLIFKLNTVLLTIKQSAKDIFINFFVTKHGKKALKTSENDVDTLQNLNQLFRPYNQ